MRSMIVSTKVQPFPALRARKGASAIAPASAPNAAPAATNPAVTAAMRRPRLMGALAVPGLEDKKGGARGAARGRADPRPRRDQSGRDRGDAQAATHVRARRHQRNAGTPAASSSVPRTAFAGFATIDPSTTYAAA